MAQACKFRHVYGQAAKPANQFLELPNPLTSGEGPYVKASHKYLAFSSTSVRRLYVRPLESPGRFSRNECHISPDCLRGKIWDFDFHPFNDNLLAMGDDNGKACVITIPDKINELGTLEANISKATIDLGTIHSKKVILLSFHPCANNILATGSFDRTVKIFDIINNKSINQIDGFGDTIYSMKWNSNGSMVGISSKDKTIRCIDPRSFKSGSNSGVIIKKAFDGVKSSKVFWISNKNCIGATGFSKFAKRQLKLWDLRVMSESSDNRALINHTIDQASSILMPRYDESNNLLYLAGKGDGTVSYGEFRDNMKKFYILGTYRSPEPQRGGGWVPKRGLNVWKCEIERFLKLTRKSIVPVSFIVPRKAGSDIFQSDIYPDTNSGIASMTSDEWINGSNKMPLLTSLDPELKGKTIENKNSAPESVINGNSSKEEEAEKKQQAKETVRTTKEMIEKQIDNNKKEEKTIKTVKKTEERQGKDSDEKTENKNELEENEDETDGLGQLPQMKERQDSASSNSNSNSGDSPFGERTRSTGSVMIRPFSPTEQAELEAAKKELENENTGLKVQVEELSSKNNTLTKENGELKSEIDKLKERIKELEANNNNNKEKERERENDDKGELIDELAEEFTEELTEELTEEKPKDKGKDKKDQAFAETSIWEDSDEN